MMVASTYNVLLEQTTEGQASAMVLEEPDYYVTAETTQEALQQIRQLFARRLSTAWQSEQCWLEFIETSDLEIQQDSLTKALQELTKFLAEEAEHNSSWNPYKSFLTKAPKDSSKTWQQWMKKLVQEPHYENFYQYFETRPGTLAQALRLLVDRFLEDHQAGDFSFKLDQPASAEMNQESWVHVYRQLEKKLEKATIVSIQIPSSEPPSENPWIKFAGVFKDDPDFAEIAQVIRSERVQANV